MGTQSERISDQLRRAILSAPMNCNQMSERLGIHRATLSRFVNGKRGLPLELIDHIGELLGLRLVVDGNPEASAVPSKAKPIASKRPATNQAGSNKTRKANRPPAGERKGR